VVDEDDPAGPDHDLPDEQEWWDRLPEPPKRVLAVRDLDLVADDTWPQALRLLAGTPQTWHALHLRGGYTAWWIERNALLAGAPPRAWRLPSAVSLAGLYDPVPDIGVDQAVLTAVGVRSTLDIADAADAGELLARLADPGIAIPPGAAMRAHAALVASVQDGAVEPGDVEPPDRVRTMSGVVRAAEDCLVLDAPWLLGVCQPDRLVSAGERTGLAEPLADVLDLPLAGSELAGQVRGRGEPLAWTDLGAVVAAAELTGLDLPDVGPVVHDTLAVHAAGADHVVPWWVDQPGAVHCEDSADALARALAWQCGQWTSRHALATLIADPEASTLLA
jgi:hypothetical protein